MVDSYEAGKVARPIGSPPRNEWGLSIGRKSEFTDLIDLDNVDRMGWDRMGWDRMGSDRPPKHVFRTSHYTQPQLRVITSTDLLKLKKYCFLALLTLFYCCYFEKYLPNEINKKINIIFSKNFNIIFSNNFQKFV